MQIMEVNVSIGSMLNWDPEKVAARAYELYPEGSCMYASFKRFAIPCLKPLLTLIHPYARHL